MTKGYLYSKHGFLLCCACECPADSGNTRSSNEPEGADLEPACHRRACPKKRLPVPQPEVYPKTRPSASEKILVFTLVLHIRSRPHRNLQRTLTSLSMQLF